MSFFDPTPEVLKLTPPPAVLLGPLQQANENKTLLLGPGVRGGCKRDDGRAVLSVFFV